MFDWFKKKPPPLGKHSDEAALWSVGVEQGPEGMLYVTALDNKLMVGHKELPRRLGVAIEHQIVNGMPDMLRPVYNDIEDLLVASLAGSPRSGVFVLKLRDERMIEWVSYVTDEPRACRIAEKLQAAFPEVDISAMSEADPDWEVFRQYSSRR